ncbi:MAG: glycosyltransferase family 4 protein [Planctomycetota bacterium]|nr:glycosyltransferase family 4 protein [Planctomycetota bacterium]
MAMAMQPVKSAKFFKKRTFILLNNPGNNMKSDRIKTPIKKICMVAYTYYVHDPRVRREAETLAEHGFTVDCFCLRAKGQFKYDQVNGVNLYRLPLSKYRGSSGMLYASAYLWFFVLSFFAITKSYFKKRYHVIQFHTLPDFIVFSGMIPKLFGAKLLLDMHEIMPEFYMSKFGVDKTHIYTRIIKWIERISVRFSSAIIVVNDPIRRILVERCAPKGDVVVVMNTADERIFGSDGNNTPPVRNKGFIAMYHGTLTYLYGLDIAIRTIAKLKDNIPDLEFRIFGNEEEADALKELAKELGVSKNVVFMDRVGIEAIPEHIKEADIGVLPTVRDDFIDLSFSNKLAEYVAMKTPVVATRLLSTLEYFTEDAISYFESEDVDAFASKVLELYNDPQKRFSQTDKAFKQYQAIKWSVQKERYIDLIESLVEATLTKK